MTDPTDKLREALDALHRVTVRFANGYPLITRATLTEARAAVEAHFSALTRERDETRVERDNALTDWSLLRDDYNGLQQDLRRVVHDRDHFREALAQARRAVPEGWRLVPVEFTKDHFSAMLGRGLMNMDRRAFDPYKRDWELMLAAAPQPPAQE